MAKTQILVVHREGREITAPAGCECHHLFYRFTATPPGDGFSAWRLAQDEGSDVLEVAQSCELFSGGYAQHALNRFFSQAMLRHRPSVVVIAGLNGCTADLSRVSALLGVPVILLLDAPAEDLAQVSAETGVWLQASLAACHAVIPLAGNTTDLWPDEWLPRAVMHPVGHDLDVVLAPLVAGTKVAAQSYDYSLYEFCQRDHPLLVGMQMRDTRHFHGCKRVLDLACGVGIFLDCLRREGIQAQGVERDERIARYARGMGLDVKTGDALEYLESSGGNYDGIYCSHFVEHLPVESVQALLQQFARTLAPDGVLVLVFPDPESIRSQLLGFWRDPEHVRFYHPELIATMATAADLELEWSSYDEQPHRVVSFSEDPPEVPRFPLLPRLDEESLQDDPGGFVARILKMLGVAPASRLRQLEARLERWSESLQLESERQLAVSRTLEDRTAQLWDISRTWAWNDNVTLRLRKRSR